MPRLQAVLESLTELARQAGVAVWRGFLAFCNSDNLTYAASIAYYALLSLFPFSMLALATVGRFTEAASDRDAALGFVLRYFPQQFDFIVVQLDALRTQSVTIGVIGGLALLWGALGVFGAVTTAINYAWGVERVPSYWKHKLVSFVMLLVAGAMLLAALLLFSAAEVVSSTWFAEVLSKFPGLGILRSLAVDNATTVLCILVVGLIFHFVPNTTVRFRDVWVGALFTGLLWKAALMVFAWYMRDMTRFTKIDGSIAAVVVFLLWVYVQAVIMLYGAQFTAAYGRLRHTRGIAASPTIPVPMPSPVPPGDAPLMPEASTEAPLVPGAAEPPAPVAARSSPSPAARV